jgi:hypothetical protein
MQPNKYIEHTVIKPLKKGAKPVKKIVVEGRLASLNITCLACDSKLAVNKVQLIDITKI